MVFYSNNQNQGPELDSHSTAKKKKKKTAMTENFGLLNRIPQHLSEQKTA